MSLLDDQIFAKFEAGKGDSSKVEASLKAIPWYCLTPQSLFPGRDGAEQMDVGVPSNMEEIWKECRDNALQLIDNLFLQHQAGEISPSKPFGRYTETDRFVRIQ